MNKLFPIVLALMCFGFTKEYNDVVIVALDDESYSLLSEKYPYPYPRGKVWGKAIENISMLGAKVIVLDYVFDVPDFSTKMKHFTRDEMLKGKYSNLQEKEILEDSFPIEDEDKLLADAILKANKNGTKVILSAKINYNPNSTKPLSLLYPSATISNDKLKNVKFGINELDKNNKYPILFKFSENDCHYSLAIKALLNYYDVNDNCINNNKQKYFYHKSFKNHNPPFLTYSLKQILDDGEICFDELIWDEDFEEYICPEDSETDDDWVDMMYFMSFYGKKVFENKIVILGSSLLEEGRLKSVKTHASVIQQLIDKRYIDNISKTNE
tara:strand:+ start:112 stop:1089 length:978 start_codon:yes stop_codon:yes gene_type:complete